MNSNNNYDYNKSVSMRCCQPTASVYASPHILNSYCDISD